MQKNSLTLSWTNLTGRMTGDTTKTALEQYPVGGIVYFAQNMESKDQVKEMIDNSQSYSKVGLFISTDEEGGMVNRLMNTVGTTYIDSMYNYKDEGTQKAHDNAYTIASDMAARIFPWTIPGLQK